MGFSLGSLNPFGERGILNPSGSNFLGFETFAGKGPPPVAPYEMDPTGRNAAIAMLGQGPRAVPGQAPQQVQSNFLGSLGNPNGMGTGPQTQTMGGKVPVGLMGRAIDPSTYYGQRAQYDQTRDQQLGANQLLRDAAMGNAPSVAELQLQMGQEANARQAMAMANSGRGNQTAALLNAQNAGVMGGQMLNQQQAALRAAEMAQARGAYSGALAGLAGQDLGAAGQSAQVAQTADELALRAGMANQGIDLSWAGLGLQSRSLDDDRTRAALASLGGYAELGANNYLRGAEINTGTGSEDRGLRMGYIGSIFGAGARAMSGGA
jgi:hypothetical protein